MKRTLLLLIPLTLAACAATPDPKEVALAPPDKDMVCVREAKTGSNMLRTRCRTAAQIEADREGVQKVEDSRRVFKGMTTAQ